SVPTIRASCCGWMVGTAQCAFAHPTIRGGSRLHARACADTCQPCNDIRVRGVERLPDLIAELEPAKEQDISQREALAADPFAAVGHLAVEPFQAIGGDHLQPR